MAFIEWGDHVAVGLPRFDDEHRQMVALVNQLHEALSTGKPRVVAWRLMGRLVERTVTHFENEEQDMDEAGYEGLRVHRAEHARLLAQLRDYTRRLETGEINLSPALLNSLKAWLTNHTSVQDKKMAAFLRSRAPETEAP